MSKFIPSLWIPKNCPGSYLDNPAGGACGILIEVELDGIPTGLSAILITDPSGASTYDFVNYVPPVPGCTDSSACNFDSNATVGDDSCLVNDCAGECGGSAVVDECGVCGGDNSSCNQPTASDSYVQVFEGGVVEFTLIASDPNGQDLEVEIITAPTWGDAVINTGLNVTYTPDPNYFGDDSFEFKVSDNDENAPFVGGWSASATVYIDVTGINDAPTAQGFTFDFSNSLDVDFTSYVYDADGDELEIINFFPPPGGATDNLNCVMGGILTPYANNNLVYEFTPSASSSDYDLLPYRVTDGTEGSSMAVVTFNLPISST